MMGGNISSNMGEERECGGRGEGGGSPHEYNGFGSVVLKAQQGTHSVQDRPP